AWEDNDGDGIPDFTGDPPFQGNFEGGAIPSGWTTFGDADWFVQSNTVINGSFSAESGDIVHSQTSSLELVMDTQNGPYSFAYETSTEGFWDYLRFYLDGSLVNSWSGITSGTHSGTVTAGYHTFQWMYYKDASVDANADTVWIDDVTLPISQTMVNYDLDDDNDGVRDEYDLDPRDPCVNMDTDGDGQPDTVATGQFDMSGTGDANYTVDCDMSDWYEDWDDDGDGWDDDLEEECGSDGTDVYDTPSDGDGDWICDNLDDDWDNDGYPNIDGSCDPVWEGLSCFLDQFNFIDSNDDGEISRDEAYFFFAVTYQGDGDDDMDDMDTTSHNSSHIDLGLMADSIWDVYDMGDDECFPETEEGMDEWSEEDEVGCILGLVGYWADQTTSLTWVLEGINENWTYDMMWFVEHIDNVGDHTFVCGNGEEIPFDYVNDGWDDCEDGSDEQQWSESGEPTNWFDCHDGSEIWVYQV
ncbi:MAG TPA: low-density lipoprotein receptor class A repeat-containing protein, partial [Candidatus Thalassarchaeaceae archaeon]|nr:low-density lipoprotein receptor class A repeat-containing protein [Candidatus Thalassarchaeaceae archaeon]